MTPKPPPEPMPAPPEGFRNLDADTIEAVADVYCHFRPRNTKQLSTVLLFPQGSRITRAQYAKRMDIYRGYESLEVKAR